MTVVIKKPGKSAELAEIAHELKAYQEIVGGYIEIVPVGPSLMMVCNEEGKLLNLPLNFVWNDDAIAGTVFFCSRDAEDITGLTKDRAKAVKAWLDSMSKAEGV
jgi:hypothetical protein